MQRDLGRADLAACRAILQCGSKSFAAAATLLPRRVRDPATVLYAFCRVADDAVDESPGATEAVVAALQARVDRAYTGTPHEQPVDRALAAVVTRERVPRVLIDALLEGMLWDARACRYENLDELHSYAARVAATVGVMMTLVMGARLPWVLARACDLGVAMQLTNIARDVGEDARRGRLYIPLAWMREVGLDPDAWLAAPRESRELASLVARLLGEADRLYRRADLGIASLPRDCRPAIRAARFIYADIGRAIGRAKFDSVNRRAVVGRFRKIFLLARAALGGFGRNRGKASDEPPLEAARFLVQACAEPS